MRTVGDKDALASRGKALRLKVSELLEKAGNVENSSGADEVNAFRRDEAGGQNVEVVGYVLVNDSVTGVYSSRNNKSVGLGWTLNTPGLFLVQRVLKIKPA